MVIFAQLPISTGVFHYPIKLAASTAVDAVQKTLKSHGDSFDLIEWVLFNKETYDVYNAQIQQT